MTVEQVPVIKIPGGEKCAIFWQLNPTPPKKHNPTGLMVVLTPGGQSVGLRQNGGVAKTRQFCTVVVVVGLLTFSQRLEYSLSRYTKMCPKVRLRPHRKYFENCFRQKGVGVEGGREKDAAKVYESHAFNS